MRQAIRYFCLIAVFIACGSLRLFSQNQHIVDSLENSLSKAIEDTNKVQTLNELAFLYAESVPDKCILYSEKSLSLSEKLNYTYGKAEAFTSMGGGYLTMGNFQKALECYNKTLKICEAAKNKMGAAVALNNIGNVYSQQGNFDLALENYLAYLNLMEKMGDKARISAASTNVGSLFLNKGAATHNMHDYENALKYTTKALEIENVLGNKYNISVDLGNIGAMYSEMGKLNSSPELFEKAHDYLQRSLKLKKEVNDVNGTAIVLVNMADLLIEQGRRLHQSTFFTAAIASAKEALAISEKIGDKYIVSFCLNKIGCAFFELNEISSKPALVDSSINYLRAGLKIADEIRAKDILKTSYAYLSKIYERKNSYKEALAYERLYSNIKDTLLNEESTKHMNEMQTQNETAEKDKKLIQKDAEIVKQQVESEKKATERNAFIIGFALTLVLAFFIFRGYRQKQKANVIITQQKKDVEKQKDIIAEKNKDITDSINYARRIQQAMLTSASFFKNNLTDFFILYKPKDIVSGDFYWGTKTNAGTILFASADCTGHGVPGAFMSMIGISKLNEIAAERKVAEPAEILNQLRHEVIKALNPENAEEQSNDGMDISLCALHIDKMKLEYAGANNSIYIVRNGELTEKKADKMPVGIYNGETKPFINNGVTLQKGDNIYCLTDGYADQFGGETGKKFKYKQLEELLVSINAKPMEEQKLILESTFEKWKGKFEQTDDILIIGVRA